MTGPTSDMVGSFAMFLSLLLTAEFVRRCLRMIQDVISTYKKGSLSSVLNGKSFPAKLQIYLEKIITPWFDLKFVCTWLIVLAIAIIKQEKNLSVSVLPPIILFLLTYVLSHDKLILNASFVENELTDGTNHIGPGLAVAWYSFIENALLKDDSESLTDYKQKQSIGSGRGISEAYPNGYFITDRPVILCPDLMSYIDKYEKPLESESGKWCMALTSGIVKIDQMQRKRNGEREWLFSMAESMYYPYEVSGTTRYCEFRVVRWKDNRPSNTITNKYFRVIDNRPLDSMRKWYHDQKGHGVSLEELNNQYELFVETLRTMLNSDDRLKDKFYILSFSGILSHELIAFEKQVRNNEKIPP